LLPRTHLRSDDRTRKVRPRSTLFKLARKVATFLERSPETAIADDIRRFQPHVAESELTTSNRKGIVMGVKSLLR
jgi:hypothetical protein